MGTVIEARCACGFGSGRIFAGGGFQNFKEVCAAPALCTNCMQLIVRNYYDKGSKCPACGEKVTFYNDPKLQAPKEAIRQIRPLKYPPLEAIISQVPGMDFFDWEREEEEFRFRLPDAEYLCPKCGKMTMEFLHIGDWD